MLKIILFISTLLISPAIADKASNKAEFTRLYAEFNELYANSEDIDPIIMVAEKLYKLASRLYGNKSEEYTIATYNLANLYDDKGGEEFNDAEEKAAELYKKYFSIQNRRKVPKDLNYLNQYIPYMIAYYNSHPFNSRNSISDKLLEITYSLNLSNLDVANLEYLVAIKRSQINRLRYSQDIFQKSYQRYLAEYGKYHFKVAETLYWVAKIDLANGFYEKAEKNLLQVMETLNNLEQDTTMLKNTSYHLLASIYHKLDKADLLEKNYKRIDTTNDTTKYLIPIHKPKAYYPLSMMLGKTYMSIDVLYDVGIDGIPKNIVAINGRAGPYENDAIKSAKKIRYYPPFKNGIAAEIKDVEDIVTLMSHSLR